MHVHGISCDHGVYEHVANKIQITILLIISHKSDKNSYIKVTKNNILVLINQVTLPHRKSSCGKNTDSNANASSMNSYSCAFSELHIIICMQQRLRKLRTAKLMHYHYPAAPCLLRRHYTPHIKWFP